MIEIPIKYTDYNDNEVTEKFTFNMTKLELVETELELDGGFEETAKRLSKTENGKEAYYLFKDLLVASYGRVSADGKRFEKSPEITNEFVQSPAMGELIISFIQDTDLAIQFFNGVFPKSMRDEVAKARAEGKIEENSVNQTLGATGPTDESEPEVKHFGDFEEEELLKMNDEAFEALLPNKPGQMTPKMLQIAMRRKSQNG